MFSEGNFYCSVKGFKYWERERFKLEGIYVKGFTLERDNLERDNLEGIQVWKDSLRNKSLRVSSEGNFYFSVKGFKK